MIDLFLSSKEFVIHSILCVLSIALAIYLLYVVGQMAEKRNRSQVLWVLVSLITSPFLSIILLLWLGDSETKNDYDKMDTKAKSVHLTTCSSAFQAELIKGRLKDAGIKCALTGEKFSTIYSITEAPFVSVGIDVLEKDYDRAVEILNQVIDEGELPVEELSQEAK